MGQKRKVVYWYKISQKLNRKESRDRASRTSATKIVSSAVCHLRYRRTHARLAPQSRFEDKLLRICMVCPQKGTAVLKGLKHIAGFLRVACTGTTACLAAVLL